MMLMNIVVCVKQVPGTSKIPIDPETGNLIREGIPGILNPDDKHAVEEAVGIKEKLGGRVTVITMGPPQAEETLRECLAMGADDAILLTDEAFAGADTLATSYVLGCAIKQMGEVALILCGSEALDGNTGQVGPELAEFLGLPQLTFIQNVRISQGTVKVKRTLGDGYEVLETRLPALLTVTRDINTPRVPSLDAVMDAYRKKEIITWTAADISVDRDRLGLKGSPTRIRKVYSPELRRGGVEMLGGALDQAIETLAARLCQRDLI